MQLSQLGIPFPLLLTWSTAYRGLLVSPYSSVKADITIFGVVSSRSALDARSQHLSTIEVRGGCQRVVWGARVNALESEKSAS